MRFPVVLLDRDGVINDNPDDWVWDWRDFDWLPGALDALRRLHEAGRRSSIITNQSCIARGLVDEATMDALHERMLREIERAGGKIEAIYMCPHSRRDGCDCRKPAPTHLLQAARDLGVDPAECCYVGDRYTDIVAADAAGMAAIIVRSGYGRDWPSALMRQPTPVGVFDDLAEFVDWLLDGHEEAAAS
jgi:D-glycero-D-manno-heptose 1,7-bisphosphate phosphatase